jgi:hypothetical protein
MTDDPSAAFVTSGRTHLAMTTPTEALTREAVRAALVELLTVGQHHNAASPATLTVVGSTRRTRADRVPHGGHRLKDLNHALNAVAKAFVALRTPNSHTTALREGLTELAAVALSWLDTITDPPQPDPDTEPH